MHPFKTHVFFAVISSLLSGCASIQITSKVLKSNDDFKVEVLHYTCENPSQKTLLIMPPTGGTNFIDRSYAKKFCQAGYQVFIIESWTGLDEKNPEFSIHQRFYSRAQRAISVTLEQVKTPFVGLLGTSVGAMHSAISSVQQPQINAIFSIVGGIPITDIIIHSDQQAMLNLKKFRQQNFGIKSDADYQEKLDLAFHLEPLNSGELDTSKKFGAVVATKDETVPTKNQNQLVEFWKPNTVLTLDNGHFWGIVNTWLFHTDVILDFFNRASQI
jgi:hypothetical protein